MIDSIDGGENGVDSTPCNASSGGGDPSPSDTTNSGDDPLPSDTSSGNEDSSGDGSRDDTGETALVLAAGGAGLLWQVDVGVSPDKYMLSVTNPHQGWCGPKFPSPDTWHVNFHVDKYNGSLRRPFTDAVANFHVHQYSQGTQQYFYVYESESKQSVFDNCFGDVDTARRQVVNAMKNAAENIAGPIAWAAAGAAAILNALLKLSGVTSTA